MVQFLKNYVNPQRVETPTVIRLRTAQTWLRKLGYLYKDIRKDVFVDGYEQSKVVENRANFLKQMEEFKPYIVEFYDGTIKPKVYPFDCAIEDENRQPIIIITHDECTFFANNGV